MKETGTELDDLCKKVELSSGIKDDVQESSQEQRQIEALRAFLLKDLEQETVLQNWQEEIALSILAKYWVHVKRFKEALNTLGLQETPNQFLGNLASWTPAFKELDSKILVNIFQETIRILGWTYPYWDNIYDKFTDSRDDFSLLPKEVEHLEACIQEAITILSSNIPQSKQFEEKVKTYIIRIVSAKLN